MKKSEVISAVNAINKIPVNKITDKGVRNALIDNYLILRKAAKGIMDEREDLLDKFRSDWAAEIAAGQNGAQPSPEFLAAQQNLDEDFGRIGKTYIDVEGLSTLDKAAFFGALGDADLNFEDIAALDGIII